MLPLLVHLVFHPASKDARALAQALHAQLDEDPALPGLRVPIVYLPEDGSGFPPASYALDEAARNLVVVLADDDMAIEYDEPPAGRSRWPDFALQLYQRCQQGKNRFLPLQLTGSAWPLHDGLERAKLNFVRTFLQSEQTKVAWTARHLVIQLYRFLVADDREEKAGEGAPIELFLSHAKLDNLGKDGILEALVEHLRVDQPVGAWVDSGQIQGGDDFESVIRAGIERSSVLAVLTDNYSTRTWCRIEILLTKRHRRPLVVVDALRDRELRSFPYIGNVPVRRWTGAADDPAACVDLLLKESLRCELAELTLEHHAQPGDHLIYAAPELATLIGLEPGTKVLYPDPPIGDEELQLLAPLGLKLETPMLRAAAEHSLAGKTITLSASASSDAAVHGLTPRHLDEAMLDLSRQLLLRGASLAYGGHLDREGYTARLLDLTLAHRSLSELPPVERVRCYLGWTLGRPKQRLAAHQRAAKWIFMPRPDGIEDLEPERFTASLDEFLPCDSPARRYAWGKAMTQMRRRQAAETDARVLIGGKIGGEGSWYLGSIPGLVEEALCTLDANKPLFVVGAFGGAGALIGDLLQGKARPEMNWDYQSRAPHAVEMRKLYEDRDGGFVDYGEIVRRFADTGLGGLDNGLSAAQNLELLRTRDLERVVALIIEGLRAK